MREFHHVLGKIWFNFKAKGFLNESEMKEFRDALNTNMNWVIELGLLESLADIAYNCGEDDWEESICGKIDQLILN